MEEGRKRWFAFEESGEASDLGKSEPYTRDSRYPSEVYEVIEDLVEEKYGRRHPNQIIHGKPRIDLAYTARQLSKVMLKDYKPKFKAAMKGESWLDKDGKHQELPHHTFIEKYIRSLPHVKYDSYWGGVLFLHKVPRSRTQLSRTCCCN